MTATTLIQAADARVHRTPNAAMTTLAAPSVGSRELAVWRVRMEPDAAGPEHTVDREQVLTVLTGALSVEVDGGTVAAGPGDTLILPAGVPRRISCGGPDAVEAVVSSSVGARVSTSADGDRGELPWAS